MEKISDRLERCRTSFDKELYSFNLLAIGNVCPNCNEQFNSKWSHGKHQTCSSCTSEFGSWGNAVCLMKITQQEVDNILITYFSDVETRNVQRLYFDTEFESWGRNINNNDKLGLISELLRRRQNGTLDQFIVNTKSI